MVAVQSAVTVMEGFTIIRPLFDGAPDKPNKRGLALMTYVQWLGSWLDSYPYYEELESIKSEGY